jgi:hypothetical protein
MVMELLHSGMRDIIRKHSKGDHILLRNLPKLSAVKQGIFGRAGNTTAISYPFPSLCPWNVFTVRVKCKIEGGVGFLF